jgi:hypothetical protein
MNDDDLVGITKAAREVGISHSTLSRQVKAGLIRSHNGKVRICEVFEDRANNIDVSIWQARKHADRAAAVTAGAQTNLSHEPCTRAHAPSPPECYATSASTQDIDDFLDRVAALLREFDGRIDNAGAVNAFKWVIAIFEGFQFQAGSVSTLETDRPKATS